MGDAALPLRFGDQHGPFTLGIGLDLLRPLEALGTEFLGLALALGLHPVIDRLAGFERQVGAMKTHLGDLDAQGPGLLHHLVLDMLDNLRPLGGQQRLEHHLSQLAAQR